MNVYLSCFDEYTRSDSLLSYIITQRLLGVCSSSAIFSGIEIGKNQGCHSSRGERQVKEVKQ